MAKASPARGAKRALVWLVVLFLALGAAIAGGAMFSNGSWTPKLGLDLEGGTQMILAPQVQGDTTIDEDQLNQAVQIIRQRVDGSGVSEAEIRTQSGKNVIVNMPGVPDDQTRNLIRASANMQFRPVLAGGAGMGAQVATPTGSPAPTLGSDVAPTPAATAPSDQAWITPALQAQFDQLDCSNPETYQTLRDTADPEKAIVSCDPSTMGKYILGPQEIPGTDIASASSGLGTTSQGATLNQWQVNLEFNAEGAEKFKQITERALPFRGPQGSPPDPRNQFAIVLDGAILSAPTINQVIPDGRAQITGNFTEQSAKALADQLRYGALPVSFDIQSENQISPTLGADQLRSGLIAGLIGLILVAIYSLFQYRLLGLVTFASLVVAGILTYQAITLLGWTENYRLTLAGVAGLIVAIGLTADSFIVYFERIRDELREGRGLVSAVETGWKRARRTIIASKAVNLLGAVVLYFVAVGNVQGFAFTLGLTAVADLVVVFLFTHPVLQLLARTKFFGGGHRFSGLDPRTLGAIPLYRGAGRLRTPEDSAESTEEMHDGETVTVGATSAASAGATSSDAARVPGGLRAAATKSGSAAKNRGASREAERRMTIAERRRREALGEKPTKDEGKDAK